MPPTAFGTSERRNWLSRRGIAASRRAAQLPDKLLTKGNFVVTVSFFRPRFVAFSPRAELS